MRGWEEELRKQGGRIREGRCLTSHSSLQHLKQQRGSFLSLPGSFLTRVDMSKRLNLPCAQAIPSPSLSLASRHIHFPPIFYHLFSSWDGFFCDSCPRAPRQAAGRCCLVQRLHETFTEQLRRSYKARGVRPVITAPASAVIHQSSTSACVHVSSVLKR